jgi:hypothetical protein
MRTAVQPLGWAISKRTPVMIRGEDGVRHRSSLLRVHPKINQTTMTAQEMRVCMASFLLHNGLRAKQVAEVTIITM